MQESKRNLEFQEEISKVIKGYELKFDCPHCHEEINESHFGEREKAFQLINEKVRKIVEEELNFQKVSYKEQWLKQIEENKFYENFQGVIEKMKTIENLTKANEKLKEEKTKIEFKLREDLAKATSADAINDLKMVQELKAENDRCKKENEELKIGNQPKIKELENNIEKLKVELSGVYSTSKIENLGRVKDLKEQLGKSQKEKEEQEKKITELKSSEYIESLERVKKLVEKNDKLNEQVQLLSHKQRMSKKQGEDLEKYVLKKLQETYNGSDEINKITHLNEKGDIIQEVYKDNQYLAKIIYEVKKGDKFKKKEWVDKLEKDMVNERAEYGVIIASCQNGQPLLKPFPQKNILVSDDENFIFASQVARMLIFSKQRLSQDENSKERIECLDGWIKEKLPNYLLKLENNLRDWEKDIMGITTIVKSMTKTREEIKRITINEISLELRKI